MIQEVRLPEISENVETGDVIKVLVSAGDAVEVDQPLLELETDKAVLEVPSPFKGKVVEVFVKIGDTIKVGQAVMKIDTAGSEAAASPGATEKAPGAAVATADGETPPPTAAGVAGKAAEPTGPAKPTVRREAETSEVPSTAPDEAQATPPQASPGVRRLARELGVDLSTVPGSGRGGRILEGDVKQRARRASAGGGERASRQAPPAAGALGADAWGPVVREPMSKIRQVTARTLGRAWATVPHVTHYDKADITALDAFRKRHAARIEAAGGKLTVTAVLVKVAASALGVFPQFNASVDADNEEIVYKKYSHIGVAVDTDRGLIVPVIRDADKKNVTELSVEITTVAEKARSRKIAPEDLEGGTFTVSNLGGIGGTGFSPIVYAPQVAILGVARARMEPVYAEGVFTPRLVLPLSVSYDHRLIDGADGARFLRWIVQAIEDPFLILLEG